MECLSAVCPYPCRYSIGCVLNIALELIGNHDMRFKPLECEGCSMWLDPFQPFGATKPLRFNVPNPDLSLEYQVARPRSQVTYFDSTSSEDLDSRELVLRTHA